VHLSASVRPFLSIPWFKNDIASFSIVHGQGIGNYNLDLQNVPNGGTDGVMDAADNIIPLRMTSYYAAYTHFWTTNLRSTAVVSQVDLEASPALGAAGYHRGRYASANLIYYWRYKAPKDDNAHFAFTSLEFLYGDRQTLSLGRGQEQRLLFSFGVKY